mmetsp:Transcript_20927/g.55828  ORF Transcript_20927/g.55828 Transcript_20927/m.55828 type:complete len:444 (+) Transcript_20927:864-2195(+)
MDSNEQLHVLTAFGGIRTKRWARRAILVFQIVQDDSGFEHCRSISADESRHLLQRIDCLKLLSLQLGVRNDASLDLVLHVLLEPHPETYPRRVVRMLHVKEDRKGGGRSNLPIVRHIEKGHRTTLDGSSRERVGSGERVVEGCVKNETWSILPLVVDLEHHTLVFGHLGIVVPLVCLVELKGVVLPRTIGETKLVQKTVCHGYRTFVTHGQWLLHHRRDVADAPPDVDESKPTRCQRVHLLRRQLTPLDSRVDALCSKLLQPTWRSISGVVAMHAGHGGRFATLLRIQVRSACLTDGMVEHEDPRRASSLFDQVHKFLVVHRHHLPIVCEILHLCRPGFQSETVRVNGGWRRETTTVMHHRLMALSLVHDISKIGLIDVPSSGFARWWRRLVVQRNSLRRLSKTPEAGIQNQSVAHGSRHRPNQHLLQSCSTTDRATTPSLIT